MTRTRALGRLPELIAAGSVQQYWIARWWLHGDAEHALDQEPWTSDFNNRLLRNDLHGLVLALRARRWRSTRCPGAPRCSPKRVRSPGPPRCRSTRSTTTCWSVTSPWCLEPAARDAARAAAGHGLAEVRGALGRALGYGRGGGQA